MKNFLMIGLAMASMIGLTGCGDEDSGPDYDPNCPFCEPEDFQDHILHSCLIAYRWNGLWNSWTACDNAWKPVSNQPVFTNLNDCLIAKGHLQDEDTEYYDNSDADRDRGYAWKLFCFNAD